MAPGRGRGPWRAWLIALTAVATLVGAAFVVRRGTSAQLRAIFVDQLDLTHPNPEFVATASGILRQAGYAVDYVPGRDVTVDLYRGLPAGDYDLILLRSHSARRAENETDLADDVTLFTAERFTWTRHVDAIRGKHVGAVYNEFENQMATREADHWASAVPPATPTADSGEMFEGKKLFFGIRGAFIEQSMAGRFTRSPTVILMGCDGLRSTRMAQAFVGKGARAFISWDQPVSPERTDAATAVLLRQLVTERSPVPDAVARAMAEVGPDEAHGSVLSYYPN